MKKAAILGFIFGLSLSAADLSGRWAGRAMLPDAAQTRQPAKAVELTLVESGSQITGTLRIAAGEARPIEAATFRDGKLTFAVRTPELMTVRLNLSGDQFEGRMTSSSGQLQNIGLRKQSGQ